MGAFYICPREFRIPDRVIDVFRKKGFLEPQRIDLGLWNLLLFSKIGMEARNVHQDGNSLVSVIGSCFYKGTNYTDNLENIFSDAVAGQLNYSDLAGTYFLLIKRGDRISFLTDRAGTQNVFFDTGIQVASSSFLAVLASANSRTPDKMACTEVLLTGNLVGPNTLVHGIHRYERALDNRLLQFENLDDFRYESSPRSRSYSEALDHQGMILNEFFRKYKDILTNEGVLTGLTGGFDSRLLYFLVRKHLRDYSVYTTFRKEQTPETKIAAEISSAVGDLLISLPFPSPMEQDPEELQSRMIDNLYFNDGMVRAHQYWMEEIKGLAYLKKLYQSHHIGFSGIGGEQYRNGEYLAGRVYSMAKWVQYVLLGQNGGLSSLNAKGIPMLVDVVSGKIARILDIDIRHNRIDYIGIKRYYNEIWNPSTRTIRNNIENQYRLFLSPFADSHVAQAAYEDIGHIRKGLRFEMDLICILCPELKKLKTDYGFSPSGRISLRYGVLPWMKMVSGFRAWAGFQDRMRGPGNSAYTALSTKHVFLRDLVSITETLELVDRYDLLLRRNILYHMVIEIGLLMKEFDDCFR